MTTAAAARIHPVLHSALINALEGQDLTKKGVGKHLQPGVVTYDEVKDEKTGEVLQPKITYLLGLEAIARMRATAAGKPVVGKSGGFDHVKVEKGKKYDGVVTDGFWDGESGWESINFRVDDAKTAEACAKGFQFSCAYIPTDVDETPGLWHNVPYDAVIIDGEYTHFAVVPNPRYDGAKIELLNSLGGVIMNKALKAVLNLIPRKDLREVVNSIEEDDKKAADEKAAAEKKNAEDKAAKRKAAQDVYDASMKNASSDEDRAKAKDAFEKMNAQIEAGDGEKQDPAAGSVTTDPKVDLPPEPLGGGTVTPEPGVPGQDKKPEAANAETPEQAQEREKKALEAKNAADEKEKKDKEEKEASEKKNAEDAKKKKEEEERVNALKVKEEVEKALQAERFNNLRKTAEERGGVSGTTFIGVHSLQEKENLGRERYGSRQE